MGWCTVVQDADGGSEVQLTPGVGCYASVSGWFWKQTLSLSSAGARAAASCECHVAALAGGQLVLPAASVTAAAAAPAAVLLLTSQQSQQQHLGATQQLVLEAVLCAFMRVCLCVPVCL
jgi:hypothetical protein